MQTNSLESLLSSGSLPSPLRTRIAPTPSGFLHIGNAFSFVLTWLIARKQGGTILLRIDDLDAGRKRPEYVEDIFRSLAWLGITYDEGPSGPDDFEANWSQHGRIDQYNASLDELRATELLFPCTCTRRSIQVASTDGGHPETCRIENRGVELDGDTAWRISTEDATASWKDSRGENYSIDIDAAMRDFVVKRKEGLPAYQVASLADDTHYGINLIVRGEDLVESTASQLWLSERLGNVDFQRCQFLHHTLLPNEQGKKLSKSAGATSLQAMRQNNETPESMFLKLSPLLGLPQPATSAKELLSMWS